MIHKEFINELKIKKLIIMKIKIIFKYGTMLNSMKKNHNTSSIRLLQQTSQQNKL